MSEIHDVRAIIFPLHTLGLIDIERTFPRHSMRLEMDRATLLSQHLNFEQTKRNIIEVASNNGIQQANWNRLDELINYKGLKWLEKNPLMFLSFNRSNNELLEAEKTILTRIRLATIKIYASWAISPELNTSSFSTRQFNNLETLDIDHYITLTPSIKGHEIDFTRINSKNISVFEDTNMNIDIAIQGTSTSNEQAKLFLAINNIFDESIKYKITNNIESKIFSRLWTALNYFRKSIKSDNISESTVNLQIAYEVMFIDSKSMEKKNQIIERAGFLLTKLTEEPNYPHSLIEEQITALTKARNDFIHEGIPVNEKSVAFKALYNLFCKLIVSYSEQIPQSDKLLQDDLTAYYPKREKPKNKQVSLMFLWLFHHYMRGSKNSNQTLALEDASLAIAT